MHGKLKIVNRKSKLENRFAGFTPLETAKQVSVSGKKRRFLTGFTITEVVVASALLIIAIVPILKGLTSTHVTSAIVERRTRSLTLAQAKLDEIKARSVYNYGDNFQENDVSLDGSYLCDVTDAASGSNLRTITVAVGYDQNGNNSLTSGEVEVTLTTLIARRW